MKSRPRTKQNLSARQSLSPTWQTCIPVATLVFLFWAVAAHAQGSGPTTTALKVALDTIWVLLCAFLVFFMNAGFCMLETGLCRQKNAVNILAKNLIVFGLATVAYWILGFGLMFADGTPLFGTGGWFLDGADNSPALLKDYKGIFTSLNWTGIPLQAKFLFQLAFAGTAATIVSGAVAERVKFAAFLVFSLVLTGILYPITGHWIWGGGWLATAGFWDFAGSTVVHSVGGWSALMGAMILGPRFNRYSDRGVSAMPGHNMAIATLGCLILWLGWFGFNAGSTMAADPTSIAHIAVTTNTAAAFGGIAATLIAWSYLGKPDLTMTINGILAGLVGITAPCPWVTVPVAALIGISAGVIVVYAVTWVDRFKVDDPVGAISVHLICGVWGTLCIGLFAVGASNQAGALYATGPAAGLFFGGGFTQLWPQILGIVSVGGFTVVGATLTFMLIKAVIGFRVNELEEIRGLDVSEHGMEAYSGFVKEEIR